MSYVIGDALTELQKLPDDWAQCCVTSPPYWGLRDYGVDGQLGLESTPEEYVKKLVEVMYEVRRVIRPDGTLWLNLGDSYAGSPSGRSDQGGSAASPCHKGAGYMSRPNKVVSGLKPKDLVGIPWRVAFALQADGWYLRSDIIWHKPNPMPESVTDRPTKSHEYIFLLSRSARYYYDADAVREQSGGDSGWSKQRRRGVNTWDYGRDGYTVSRVGGMSGKETLTDDSRHLRSVWTVRSKPYKGAHFASFPEKLITRCILAGAPPDGFVIDPFLGSGTTGRVAEQLGRRWWGCELNPKYEQLIRERTAQVGLPLG